MKRPEIFNAGLDGLDYRLQNLLDRLRMPVPPQGTLLAGVYKINGIITVHALADQLSKATYRFPMVAGKAISIISRNDIAKDLAAGLVELNMTFFPDIRFWSSIHRNAEVSWNGTGVMQIKQSGMHSGNVLLLAVQLTQTVKQQLHATGLMYKSSVDKMKDVDIFPWMQKVSRIFVYFACMKKCHI